MSSYYDSEASVYDESRGGTARARAVAQAVRELVPPDLTRPGGSCLDLAGGTGSVSAEMARSGLSVFVADTSVGMLGVAGTRLPGRVLCTRAERLALRDGSVDLVTAIWLLHLLPVEIADQVIAEAARVLRPGGHLVATVDKDLAEGRARRTDADASERVVGVAHRCGLVEAGTNSFVGQTRWTGFEDRRFPVLALRNSSDNGGEP